jgi:hypothetical protein
MSETAKLTTKLSRKNEKKIDPKVKLFLLAYSIPCNGFLHIRTYIISCSTMRPCQHIIPYSQRISTYENLHHFIFGIIRSAGGGQNKPTASSLLQLLRMLSLYYPTKTVLRGCNVDGQEKMEMLTSYTDWLIKRFKDNRKTNKPLKKYMKDILLTNIKVEIEHNLDFDVDVTVKNQNVVHQISGYLIYLS